MILLKKVHLWTKLKTHLVYVAHLGLALVHISCPCLCLCVYLHRNAAVVVWMAPTALHVWMFGLWGVTLLGSMYLLELMWSCWRKHVTVEAGLKVSYAQATLSVGHSLLPVACGSRYRTFSYFSSTMSICMLPCFPLWWWWIKSQKL